MAKPTPKHRPKRAQSKSKPQECRHSPELQHVLDQFHEWLALPDDGPVLVALAAVAANILPGQPVWIMFIAPPSSGKTAILGTLLGLPHIHQVSTLTEASFLSATSVSDRADDASGGLLREVGKFGILLAKDFTSVIDMQRDKRTAVLAALREIYDGSWTRRVGVDGGRKFGWDGKAGFIGASTSAIDSHHSVMNSMGARFAFYRVERTNDMAQARRALESDGGRHKQGERVRGTVTEFFRVLRLKPPAEPEASAKPQVEPPALTREEQMQITAVSTLIATGRSAVERDSKKRDVVQVHEPELPARLAQMLGQLMKGLIVIGADRKKAMQSVVKVAFDSLPPPRRVVLESLCRKKCPLTVNDFSAQGGFVRTLIVRAFEDLNLYGIVQCKGGGAAHLWELSEEWRGIALTATQGSLPEKTTERG